jgi:hypothetical protein
MKRNLLRRKRKGKSRLFPRMDDRPPEKELFFVEDVKIVDKGTLLW